MSTTADPLSPLANLLRGSRVRARLRPRERARAGTRFIPALPTLRLTHFLPNQLPRPVPFPLGETSLRARRYYLARGAIVAGLRQLELPAGALALMPAYHHGVEVEAVRAAGIGVRFYRVGHDLSINLDDVRARLDGRVRVLYATHFAGFPAPIQALRALADQHGLVLVEDCALALLSRAPTGEPLGSFGDLAVFCLYKSVPIPHGGVLVTPRLPGPAPASPPLVATLSHMAGSLLRRVEATSPSGLAHTTRAAVRSWLRPLGMGARMPVGQQHLDPGELGVGASRLVDLVLPNLDYQEIVARRRRNYQRLAAALDDRAPVPTGPLPEGACPLFVPAWVDDRDTVLHRLWARRVEAVDLWRHGYEPPGQFPDVTALRRHVIEIPCHQDLDDGAIDYVASAVVEALRD
jgi:dTDP-4-amino-4,6-dideoxygalactose transaminase